MRLHIFSLVLFLCTSFELVAQQIAKSGGSSNSTFLLGNTGYARKSQLLYNAAVLTNEQPGKISRIYFKYGTTGTALPQTLGTFTIKLGHTTQTGFTGSAFFTDLVKVLDSTSFTIPAKTDEDWFSIEVDTIFEYDPSKTLIVQTSFQTSTVANWGTMGTSNTPVRKIISEDTGATIGVGTSSTWQDFGFDVISVPTSTTPQVLTGKTPTLFPNPSSDKITIELSGEEPEPKKYTVYNVLGQPVMSGFFYHSNPQLDISLLKPASYVLEISGRGKPWRSPFVKN